MEIRNFINGNFIKSISKQNIRVVDPANQTDVGFIDEALEGEVQVTVIATGFEGNQPYRNQKPGAQLSSQSLYRQTNNKET